MHKIKKFIIPGFISLFVFLALVAPAFSFAYTLGAPLVPPCDKISVPGQCIWGWNELLLLVNNVITFLIKYMAIPIAAIMFAYAGFELVTSGGSTEKRGIAKKVFLNTFLGLLFAAAGWLIVKTILSILGYQDASWIGF